MSVIRWIDVGLAALCLLIWTTTVVQALRWRQPLFGPTRRQKALGWLSLVCTVVVVSFVIVLLSGRSVFWFDAP